MTTHSRLRLVACLINLSSKILIHCAFFCHFERSRGGAFFAVLSLAKELGRAPRPFTLFRAAAAAVYAERGENGREGEFLFK